MYVNFNITFRATTEFCDTGPGASKRHEQSLTHTGCQLNSEKLFFLSLISLQTVWQGYRCTPIRQWIWARNKIQIVLLITVMKSKNGSNSMVYMVRIALSSGVQSWEALPEVTRGGHVWFRGWLLLRVAKLKSLTTILSTSPSRSFNSIEVITLDQRCLKEGNIPLQKKLTTSLHFLQLQQKPYLDANKTQI